MSGLNVKNTMIQGILQIIAPHHCSGCAKIGSLLCPHCKNDIIDEPFMGCFICQKPSLGQVCDSHRLPIEKTLIMGARHGSLETLINSFKFKNVKAAGRVLAELLDDFLPILPDEAILVSIPTVRAHIRQRGYDHIDLVTRNLADIRGIRVATPLLRQGNAVQHESTRADRQTQAKAAFRLNSSRIEALMGEQPSAKPLLILIDDVITTGSTVSEAAKLLSAAGARVWVVGLAYQPLD